MTVFEFLSVAISIVYSLAVVRLINGLPLLVAGPRRYWVHVGWVVGLMTQISVIWWNLWALSRKEHWIFPEFALLLIISGVVYFLAATLVPDAPATIESWRTYFFQVRRRFFLAGLLLFGCLIASSWFLLEVPIVHPMRIGQGANMTLLLIGALSKNPRVHGALVTVALSIFGIIIGIFFLRPGGFAGY